MEHSKPISSSLPQQVNPVNESNTLGYTDQQSKQYFEPLSTDSAHRSLGAWFLGPKGENGDLLEQILKEMVQDHAKWRKSYFVSDPPYITEAIKDSPEYKQQVKKIQQELTRVSKQLQNSAPFFSSRYKGHMNWDVSLVGLLGYFVAMLYNPNNVAAEGSPVTTMIEHEVGMQLCHMLGFFDGQENNEKEILPWGHITSCGTVANIEALWAARNVKYLPLTIKLAIQRDERFQSAKGATVYTAAGKEKVLVELSEWELCNIPLDDALHLQLELTSKYGFSVETVSEVLSKYDIQHEGMYTKNKAVYFVPVTRHYCWDKAGALLGIGQSNMRIIPIDENGRLDICILEKELRKCIKEKIAVYQVVAVVGTTAEGVVDPVIEILALRERLRKEEEGLDFCIHCDAAWGGYFCTMLPQEVQLDTPDVVPCLPLGSYAVRQLRAIAKCDSITVDPHKSGFIQYPAGGLCYRNNYTRHLLAFQAPIIYNGKSDPSIGIFGVEGSKPGASVVAVYLHHNIVGLNPEGHGRILGQAHFTTKKIYAILATMASSDDPFQIALFHPPSLDDKKFLRERIVNRGNQDLLEDVDALQRLAELGSDLLINCFTINFSWPILESPFEKREHNISLAKLNQLIDVISDDLNMGYSILSDDPLSTLGVGRKRLFIIRNKLGDPYGKVTNKLQTSLGIKNIDAKETLCLINSNLDPWPTAVGFLNIFEHELRQSILRGIGAIMEEKHLHGFVVSDALGNELFGDHLPVFTEPQHNYHLILKLQFESQQEKTRVLEAYSKALGQETDQTNKPLIIGNINEATLHSLLYRCPTPWTADCFIGFPGEQKPITTTKVFVSDVLLNEHFDPRARYPPNASYFIYGQGSQVYMSHCLTRRPDYHHTLELASVPNGVSSLLLEMGFKAILTDINGDPTYLQAEQLEEKPLKLRHRYNIKFDGDDGVSQTSSLLVKKEIWFDTSHINVNYTCP